MSDLKATALGYARLGWHVHPLKPGLKEPDSPHGFKDATTDPDQIEAWWDEKPDRNIGIATGPSGLAVVDADTYKDDVDLAVIERLPGTLTARTARGGVHHIYVGELPSGASNLGAGIDTRGEGGYIVAAPSVTDDGAYSWVERQEPAALPSWVADELAKPDPADRQAPAPTAGANNQWGQTVLEGELGKIAMAVEGTRNQTLFKAACKVFEAVKGGHIEEAHAWVHLETAAQRAGLGRTEIDKTLESAWDRTDERHPAERDTPQPEVQPEPSVTDLIRSEGVADQHDPKAPKTFQVLDLEKLRNLPPPEWLLEERLPEGFTVLYGEPGLGKTFVALDWALTIASKSGRPILYFAGEGSTGLGVRVQAWLEAHPRMKPERFHVVPECPWLLDPLHIEMLRATVAAHDPALIVVDTWARALVGGNENSAEDVSQAVGVLDRLRNDHACSSLVIHHASRAGNERGSTALRGAADSVWQIKTDEALGPDAFSVDCSKLKDGEKPTPIHQRLRSHGPSVVPWPSTPRQLGLTREAPL